MSPARTNANPHARPRAARSPAPRHPRRVSGPLRARTVGGGAVALPAPRRRGSTGAFERLRALPDHRMVDRLLRGRAWIWLVGILLGGIVAMQVSLLKLNAGISRAVEASSTLERQNASLEESIGRLSSSERILGAAERDGMVMPPAGQVAYLDVRPRIDARRALARMRPPSDEARMLMANAGREPLPGGLPAAGAGTAAPPAAGETAAPAATATAPATTATTPTGAAAPTTTAANGSPPAGEGTAGAAAPQAAPGTAPTGGAGATGAGTAPTQGTPGQG